MERFDIIHCHLFGANWIAKPLAYLLGHRVIFNHDHCNDALRERGFFLALDHFMNQFSTRIFAVSHSVVRFLIEKENLPPALVEYFPNGADVDGFPSAMRPPSAEITVGGVGRLVVQKDFATFLEIAALIQKEEARVRFVIYGDGPEESALRERAQSLGVAVTFAGFVADRAAIFGSLDLLLLTSRYEGTPMVLLEAMVSGVPIVATAVDGTLEILSNDQSALFFPPGDSHAGAAAVPGYSSRPGSPSRSCPIRAGSGERALHNAKKQIQELETLYARCLVSLG